MTSKDKRTAFIISTIDKGKRIVIAFKKQARKRPRLLTTKITKYMKLMKLPRKCRPPAMTHSLEFNPSAASTWLAPTLTINLSTYGITSSPSIFTSYAKSSAIAKGLGRDDNSSSFVTPNPVLVSNLIPCSIRTWCSIL